MMMTMDSPETVSKSPVRFFLLYAALIMLFTAIEQQLREVEGRAHVIAYLAEKLLEISDH